MTISSRFVWGGVLAILVSGGATGGEEAARAVVGHGSGVLAVRDAARQIWEMADEGALLPQECELRTAGVGPCRVLLGGGTLIADSDGRVNLSAGQRLIGLEAGRAFARTEADQVWTVTLGPHRAVLAGDTEAELSFRRDGAGAIAVLSGSATIARGEGPATELGAGRTAAWSSGKDESIRTEELSEDDKNETGPWTVLGSTPQGLGQLLVKDAQTATRRRLNVARYHVNVVLQPPAALVQIDQSFYNPFDRQEEGTFVFNLPRGASVSRFAMYVTPGKLVEGEVIDRDRARAIYQTIVDRQKDPAILEQIGDNLFRMRVFPIFANDTKRILLDYTIPLTAQHGEYQFRLPLFSDLEPIWDFRLTGSILGPTRDGSLLSLSHPDLAFIGQGERRFGFEMKERLFQPQGDFLLSFRQEDEGEVHLRSFLAPPLPTPAWAPDDKEPDPWSGRAATYFMATIRPEETPDSAQSPPADVLLLADTSSGMRGVAAVRDAIRTVIHNLGSKDRVRLMAVDVAARQVHDGWVASGSAEAEGVLERFEQEFCLGGTDLATSFRQALASFTDSAEARRRVLIYVGDGEDGALSSIGARVSAEDLTRDLAEASVTFVGVIARQASEGPATLDCLARGTGGLSFDLTAGRGGHRGLFGWLLAGLPSPEKIEHLEVEGAAAEDVFVAPAWMPGEPLEVVGRTVWTDRLRLKLATWRGDKRQVRRWELKVADEADDIFVGRLWAQRKLAELCGYRSVAQAAVLHDRIVALSQEWSVLTPHTAFLVLESEKDYRHWQVDRRVRRRYWKPAEALPSEPLPKAWLARVTPDDSQRRQDAEAKRFARAVVMARDALEHENYALAHGVLLDVARLEAAKGSEEFAGLLNRAAAEVNRESVLRELGAHRGLFEPHGHGARLGVEARLAPLLTRSLGLGGEFLRRHPHAPDLLLDIPVRSRQGRDDGFNVKELAGLLGAATGANVVIDERALEDVSLGPETELDVYGSGRMSLRNYVRFVLDRVDLVMIEEASRILITTPEEAQNRLRTEVYPVADLYLKDHPIQLESLANAYLDCDQAAEERIESKLDRPISVDFEKMPLNEALERLAGELDDTVLIDHRSLEDVSLAPDHPVTAHWKNVPARQVLRWLLDQLDLGYYVSEEALVVATPEVEEERLETRLHSGRGIVFEYEVAKDQGEGRAWYRNNRYNRWGSGYMGAMGAGGFGGMGGMGGMMGGMGSMGSPAVGGLGAGDSGGVDLVLSTDPSAPQETAPAAATDEGVDGLAPEAKPPAGTEAEKAYVMDVDSVIGQVTGTVDPDSWEDVGGPGSLAFFTPTLDFVVRQRDSIHRQIEALFATMRDLPTVWKGSQMRQATARGADAADPRGVDLDELIEMISATVDPCTWEDVGGPGSIAPDLPRLALVVRTTHEVHDQVGRLLTLLRRSHYAAEHGVERWEEFSEGSGGGQALNRLLEDREETRLPEPEPAELECLGVRGEPGDGRWQWRYVEGEGSDSRALGICRHGDRLEIDEAEATFRVVGDEAAIGYGGLLLVECGRWGEAVRQLADAWLPWMPHRTNRELARAFRVKRLDRRDDEHPDWVFLCFLPNGSIDDGVRIEAAFSRDDGRLRSWESYERDRQTARIRFVAGGDDASAGSAKEVILEDALGKPLARWDLVWRESECPAIADLTDGWEGYVQWDRRSRQAAVDEAFPKALAAIRSFDWSRAAVALEECLQAHPQHPLVELLLAWCRARQSEYPARDEIPAVLGRVASTGASGLVRFIDRNSFPALSAEQLYDILSRQPEDAREAFDLDRLTETAMDAGRLEEALGHVQAGLVRGARDGREFERTQRLIKILLRLDRVQDALKSVDAWKKEAKPAAEKLATVGEILARAGQEQAADRLFAEALEATGLASERRYDLLVRSANVRSDLPRWRALLAAAAIRPVGSKARNECVDQVMGEMGWPFVPAEVAAKLADEVQDAEIKVRLRIQQADLTEEPAAAAEIVWGIYRTGQLPDERFGWACRLWQAAFRGDLVIEAAEDWLRSARPLPDLVQRHLEEAYRASGRSEDAKRAATGDLETR